jgi:GGDEF domain-containing protein
VEELAASLMQTGHLHTFEFDLFEDIETEVRRHGLRFSYWWDGRSDDAGGDAWALRPGLDRRTGLSNWAALEVAEEDHNNIVPFSVVCADLDWFGETSAILRYADAESLLEFVGASLAAVVGEAEMAARYHPHAWPGTGDAFVLLLPGADAAMAERRAGEIEAELRTLAVPRRLAHAYRGATTGWASRTDLSISLHGLRRRAHIAAQEEKIALGRASPAREELLDDEWRAAAME